MEKVSSLKNLGLVLMVFGLGIMVIAYILTNNHRYDVIGAAILCAGGLVHHFGDQQLEEN